MNKVIKSMWAFRRKRKPNGKIPRLSNDTNILLTDERVINPTIYSGPITRAYLPGTSYRTTPIYSLPMTRVINPTTDKCKGMFVMALLHYLLQCV
eukprot:scaffold9452_cov197-Amphora_coffeaeformis.AAC.1